jgi:kynurenine formamidase
MTAGSGALNHLTGPRVAAATRIVQSGVTVTLSQPLRTEARIDVPQPADHHMTMLTDVDTEGVGFPIHVLAINAMGIHLLDYLQFEDLARHCETERRWEFLFMVAPLQVVGGTGSPVNPIAMF